MLLFVRSKAPKVKQVKLETSHTVILTRMVTVLCYCSHLLSFGLLRHLKDLIQVQTPEVRVSKVTIQMTIYQQLSYTNLPKLSEY